MRSKKGWVSERDANTERQVGPLHRQPPTAASRRKVVDNASWGSWIVDDEILFVRGTKIFRKKLRRRQETAAGGQRGRRRPGRRAAAAAARCRSDGKYIAITLRGSKRETGIWDIDEEDLDPHRRSAARSTGRPTARRSTGCIPPATAAAGCSAHADDQDGKPPKDVRRRRAEFIDLPGRRSHEYFPRAVARRQMDGLGGHPARPRPRHRRLRDLPVAGGHARPRRRRG